jgi:hypothetical protein
MIGNPFHPATENRRNSSGIKRESNRREGRLHPFPKQAGARNWAKPLRRRRRSAGNEGEGFNDCREFSV